MKKFFAIALLLIMGITTMLAESTNIKNRDGKVVGRLEWSYSIQTHETRDGSFTTITATNNSPESVSVSFKTDAGGYASLSIPAYETKEAIIGTDKRASRAICVGVSAR